MKLKSATILLLIIANLAISQSKENVSLNQNWKTLNTQSFQINYPHDWELDESGKMGTSFFLYSPLTSSDDKFTENVNMMFQDLTQYNLNLEQFVDLSKKQVADMLTDGKIDSHEVIERNGQTIHKLKFFGKQGILNLQFLQYYFSKIIMSIS
jgi:hypothetical protein